MAAKVGGYLNRLVKRLTKDPGELEAEEQSRKAAAGGARRAVDCHSGEEVVVLGRLRSVELRPANDAASLEAELSDGSDDVTLVWLGRRKIPGIEPGRTLKVRGRLAERDGQKVLYNPYYELQVPR